MLLMMHLKNWVIIMSKSHYIIPIFVPHEGCPHNCVFCNQNSITGFCDSVDSQYTENVIKQHLSTMDHSNSIIEVSFYGGTFTAININKQKQLLSVAKRYKDLGKIDFIHLSTRPDYINKIILDNLKDYSVDIIELGVQSLDEDVLKQSGRGHSSEDVYKASKLIKEYNFTLGIQIMLGLPGDTFEKDLKTARDVIKIHPSLCRIYPALVIKNTPMEKMFKKGEYTPYTLNKTIEICKKIYGMFISNDINVMRIGLQPTDEINVGKELIGGPFHPAIRELVEGSICNDMICEALSKICSRDVKILVNPRDLSKLYTNKKQYFKETISKYKDKKIVVTQNTSICKGNFEIIFRSGIIKLSYYDYIKSKYKKYCDENI